MGDLREEAKDAGGGGHGDIAPVNGCGVHPGKSKRQPLIYLGLGKNITPVFAKGFCLLCWVCGNSFSHNNTSKNQLPIAWLPQLQPTNEFGASIEKGSWRLFP